MSEHIKEHYHKFPEPNSDEITGQAINIDGQGHVHRIGSSKLTAVSNDSLSHKHILPGDGISSTPVDEKGNDITKQMEGNNGDDKKAEENEENKNEEKDKS